MALNTTRIKPCADISGKHTLFPEDSGAAYLLVSEAVADGDATYICHGDGTSGEDVDSAFKLTLSDMPLVYNLVAASVSLNTRCDSVNGSGGDGVLVRCAIKMNGTEYILNTTEQMDHYIYKTNSIEVSDTQFITDFNDYLDVNKTSPEIELYITTSFIPHDSGKGLQYYAFHISQVYMTLTYDTGIQRKIGNSWVRIKEAYQKQSGKWVEIDKDVCKSIIQSNFLIDKCDFKGHAEKPLSDIKATCLETGMTGGKYCSFCSVILKEHDTVLPALGHNSKESNGTATCTEDGMIGGTECSRCGITLTEHNTVQPALGHNEVAMAGTATCTEDGMQGGTKCSRCSITIKEHDTIQPALGHNFSVYTGKCSRCSEYDPSSQTFTVLRNSQTSATTYHFMPNLTWEEWVHQSDYSPFGGWRIDVDGSIRYQVEFLGITDFTVDNVKSTDLIIAGYAYTATDNV